MRLLRRLRHGLLLLAAAAAVHLLAVWALPRVVMHRLSASALPEERSSVVLPPMTDHTQRRIVMPSPDMLYAACALDLSDRPMRIRAEPRTAHYWSIALYAANSDNFFVINDRQAAGAPVDLLLLGPGPYAQPPVPAQGARTVTSPTAKGLLLMRLLVADYAAEQAVVEAARRTLRCEPAEGPG